MRCKERNKTHQRSCQEKQEMSTIHETSEPKASQCVKCSPGGGVLGDTGMHSPINHLPGCASLTLAWARVVSPRGNGCWLRPLWFSGWVGVNVSKPHRFTAGVHAEAVGWWADPGGTSALSLPASLPWVSDVYPWLGFFVVCKPLTVIDGRALLKPQTYLQWYVNQFALLQQKTPRLDNLYTMER